MGGDIFAFVGLATGKGASEQLEMIASMVGINGTSKLDDTLETKVLGPGSIPSTITIKSTNQWIAYGLVPKYAKAFEPKKDMRYLFKDKELDGV
jgi:hypothetical protein